MTMKDSYAEKGAHNQAFIREVNERIEKLADAAHPEFLCESADTSYVEMIELSIASTSRSEARPSASRSSPATTTRSSSGSSKSASTTPSSRCSGKREEVGFCFLVESWAGHSLLRHTLRPLAAMPSALCCPESHRP